MKQHPLGAGGCCFNFSKTCFGQVCAKLFYNLPGGLLEHLNDKGVLSVSRWYFRDFPAEAYRFTSLATASLARIGISKPRDHIVLLRNMEDDHSFMGSATILVSRTPFSEDARMACLTRARPKQLNWIKKIHCRDFLLSVSYRSSLQYYRCESHYVSL